jgi:hypothetical protein
VHKGTGENALTVYRPNDFPYDHLHDLDVRPRPPLLLTQTTSNFDDEEHSSVVDKFLASLSFVMLLVALGFWAGQGEKSLNVPLWDVMVVFDARVAKSPAASGMHAFKQKLESWCPSNNTFAKDLAMTPMYGLNAFPVVTLVHQEINLWLLVIPVIAVTFCFQVYRSTSSYNPKGPSAGRWVEYAVTSPLMVILVALSFHIREQSTLLCLAGLQALLVSIGFGIEREIQLFFDQLFFDRYSSVAWRQIFNRPGFRLMYAASWFAHACIWITIWARSRRENAAVNSCTFENVRRLTEDRSGEDSFDQMEALLNAILGSQFAFFTVYGVLPLNTCRLLDRFYDPDDPNSLDKAWRRSAKYYSVMSVVVKTLLICLFIAYARQVPAIYADQTLEDLDESCHVQCNATLQNATAPQNLA